MKTDLELQQDVIAELKWEPSVDAADIAVEVRDGVVTLTGQVCNYAEKLAVERAAQRVWGVRELAADINVSLPGSSRRNDADIAQAARHVMEWMTYPPQQRIDIRVEDGWITLSGEVDWEYQRRAAKNGVRQLIGVTGVSDLMSIKPQSSMETVKSGIEAALKRRARKDAESITVDLAGDCVTLSGTVHSWDERRLAERSAWSAPGVRSVIDNIAVAY